MGAAALGGLGGRGPERDQPGSARGPCADAVRPGHTGDRPGSREEVCGPGQRPGCPYLKPPSQAMPSWGRAETTSLRGSASGVWVGGRSCLGGAQRLPGRGHVASHKVSVFPPAKPEAGAFAPHPGGVAPYCFPGGVLCPSLGGGPPRARTGSCALDRPQGRGRHSASRKAWEGLAVKAGAHPVGAGPEMGRFSAAPTLRGPHRAACRPHLEVHDGLGTTRRGFFGSSE